MARRLSFVDRRSEKVDMVFSTTALWRFQGLIDFRVSSLEYSKIQAGPNATSGLAAWFPIGYIEMDSAAQTGDLPMQRIGPVWDAEGLAVSLFQRRKSTGQRVRIIGTVPDLSAPHPNPIPTPGAGSAPEPPGVAGEIPRPASSNTTRSQSPR